MKAIVLATLFALGVTLAAAPNASAAGLGSGIAKAAKSNSLIEDVRCRSRRVCTRGWHGHLRCHWRRYCW